MYSYDNELYHYGVLGMRWGRRNTSLVTPSNKNPTNYTNGQKKKNEQASHTDII